MKQAVPAAGSVAAFAIAIGWLYAIIIFVCPWAFLNVLATIVFSGVIGEVAARVPRRFEVERRVVVPIVIVAPFVAHYAGWAVWVLLVSLFHRDAPILDAFWAAVFPPALFDAVGEINDVGTW